MGRKKLVIPRVWRSEFYTIIFFLIVSVVSITLSRQFPSTIISQEVNLSTSFSFFVSLPLLWLIPLVTFMIMVARIYNVSYSINATGVEAIEGRISLWQRNTMIKYEDIRGIATRQTLLGRALNIGDVVIGTAATSKIEIYIEGIASPQEVQDLIRRERDARNKRSLEANQE